MINPKETDVVILCGGLGTRLRRVIHDRPKPMAEINKRPFLDILINYMISHGFVRFILCTGYLGSAIKNYYEDKDIPVTLLFSGEEEALGTGGAIKNSETFIQSEVFLVMNGDSFCKLSINDFFYFHTLKKAFASVALVFQEKSSDCGVIKLNSTNQITGFHEKIEMNKSGFVNAGIYLFNREVLSLIPGNKKYSLEFDLFPKLIDNKPVYGFATNQQFVDIGTPERYELAKEILNNYRIQHG